MVEYVYDGDNVSDYLGHVRVRTNSDKVALRAAEKYAMSKHPEDNPGHFKIVDDNYLFVGDFSIDKLNKDDFGLDYHYVKSSEENLTTSALIDDLKKKIYDYNPSDVFLNIGMTDLKDNKSIDEIIVK